MKLRNHADSGKDDGPQIKAVEEVTTPALVGICLGSAVFLVTLAAVTYFCYRRKLGTHKLTTSSFKKNHHHNHSDKPLVLRKPSAVKSPSSGPAGPILKKSPSPTQQKHPPGQKTPPGPPSCSTTDKDVEKNGGMTSDETVYVRQISPTSSESCKQQSFMAKISIENENNNKERNNKEHTEIKEKEIVEDKPNKLGKLHFKLKYNPEKHALQVTIVRCNDLPAKDPNIGTSDPYVKLQLLPEKQHKVKTRVLRKTLNPVYDEDFTFYGINPNQLQATTLHFVVLSFDRYSRDDVIGEVVCPLSTGVDLESLTEKQLAMTKEITPRNLKIRYQGRGELLVSLCYQPAANRLTVVVLKARNLPKMDITGLCDPYVKIYLLYNNQRIAKKKTHVKKRTVNPVFNESFVFEVPYNEGLENISLEFLVLDWDRVTKNEVIGRLELGPRCGGAAQQHWNEVCNSPRRQIAEWHKLKE